MWIKECVGLCKNLPTAPQKIYFKTPCAGTLCVSLISFSPRIIVSTPCPAKPLSYIKPVASFDDGLASAPPQLLEFLISTRSSNVPFFYPVIKCLVFQI